MKRMLRVSSRILAVTGGGMTVRAEDIEVYSGELDRPYKTIGKIHAKLRKRGLQFYNYPTEQEAFKKLQELALGRGANAVIWATTAKVPKLYSMGTVLKVSGTAVWAPPTHRQCPHCKEAMRLEASVCPHCRLESDPVPEGSVPGMTTGGSAAPAPPPLHEAPPAPPVPPPLSFAAHSVLLTGRS
jgi:hypothetical protein